MNEEEKYKVAENLYKKFRGVMSPDEIINKINKSIDVFKLVIQMAEKR